LTTQGWHQMKWGTDSLQCGTVVCGLLNSACQPAPFVGQLRLARWFSYPKVGSTCPYFLLMDILVIEKLRMLQEFDKYVYPFQVSSSVSFCLCFFVLLFCPGDSIFSRLRTQEAAVFTNIILILQRYW